MYPSSEISARYFSAAKKRLGLVMSSNKLVAVQCLFLAGIYHMYTMNQFAAWKMFNAASVSCEGYLHRKERAKAADVSSGTLSLPSSEPTRHLEQRIYWSCLKSELFVPISVKKKRHKLTLTPPTKRVMCRTRYLPFRPQRGRISTCIPVPTARDLNLAGFPIIKLVLRATSQRSRARRSRHRIATRRSENMVLLPR